MVCIFRRWKSAVRYASCTYKRSPASQHSASSPCAARSDRSTHATCRRASTRSRASTRWTCRPCRWTRAASCCLATVTASCWSEVATISSTPTTCSTTPLHTKNVRHTQQPPLRRRYRSRLMHNNYMGVRRMGAMRYRAFFVLLYIIFQEKNNSSCLGLIQTKTITKKFNKTLWCKNLKNSTRYIFALSISILIDRSRLRALVAKIIM